MNKTVFNSLKRALWKFFCDCLRKNPSNPRGQGCSKNLRKKDEEIVYAAKARLPKLQEILNLAIESVGEEAPDILKPEYIKEHLSECILTLENKAFDIYLKKEEEVFISIIEEWVFKNEKLIQEINQKFPNPTDFTKKVCESFYPMVKRMEFDFSQIRKSRGGKTFEHIIEHLLKKMGLPCQRPSKEAGKILKRVDLVVPDQETAIKRPDSAFFLSCKRTLRERWKQAIPERKPSWRVFLLTIDEGLAEDKAMEINSLGIIVYVRDELKDKPHLQDKEWVRRLSKLHEDITKSIC